MSARVFNPIMLTEFYKITSPKMMKRNLPSNRKLNTIKKDLFGAPNPNETKRIFEDELEKHQDMACKKWGFDFRNGYPTLDNSQYIWERVSFQDFIPEIYTLTRAAHVVHKIPILDSSTSSLSSDEDLLMDIRSAKENELSSSNHLFLNNNNNNNNINIKKKMNKYNRSIDGSDGTEEEYEEHDDHIDIDDDDDDIIHDHKCIIDSRDIKNSDKRSIIFKVPVDGKHFKHHNHNNHNRSRLMAAASTAAATAAAHNTLQKKRRQTKIIEYMKERKRLSATPKKISPIKKMRMTTITAAPTIKKFTTKSASITASAGGGGGGGGGTPLLFKNNNNCSSSSYLNF